MQSRVAVVVAKVEARHWGDEARLDDEGVNDEQQKVLQSYESGLRKVRK